MALQSSGAISLSEIQTEFGGSNPISLSEYYAGGANVPSGTTGDGGAIPTSGEISIGDFYGASNRVSITLTISTNTNYYNIFNNRGGTYVAGISDVTLVNNANIYSTSGLVGLDTGSGWTAGDTITIDNNALIVGHGGDGGAGSSVNSTTAGAAGAAGGVGGTAMNLSYDITLDNTGGTISGGSGGGGGGGASVVGEAVKGGTNYWGATGGGGGAGRASASGGAAGGGSAQNGTAYGSAGNASSITALGTGGAGGTNTTPGTHAIAGAGGNGGANSAGAGANGVAGTNGSTSAGGTGGAGGRAINLNGNSITYTATGTIYGVVS